MRITTAPLSDAIHLAVTANLYNYVSSIPREDLCFRLVAFEETKISQNHNGAAPLPDFSWNRSDLPLDLGRAHTKNRYKFKFAIFILSDLGDPWSRSLCRGFNCFGVNQF